MKPIIYQIFTRHFGNANLTRKHNGTIADNGCGKMNAFTPAALKRIKQKGFTHIWLTGVIRHASATSYAEYGIPTQHHAVVKGLAGSPYAITDYYDIDPDLAEDVYGRMAEFEALVERIHKAGMKVIIDFVPNHVARQYKSVAKPEGVVDLGEDDDKGKHFDPNNNFYYFPGQPLQPGTDLQKGEPEPYTEMPARATGNDRFDPHPGQNDWYETVKLNYGIDYLDAGGRSTHFCPIPDTWNKMTDILLFWAAKGIDGFRCDMAEMVPSAFWAWGTDKVKYRYPQMLFIGEVYNPGLYREYINAGFDWLYDKVGMYDCLRDVICNRRPATDITHQWQATDDILDHMLYFLENHDEQRIASQFFAGNTRAALPALTVCAMLRGNALMVYAGQEYGERGMDNEGFSGEDGRTTIFDYWNVDSLYKGYVNRRKLSTEEKWLEQQYSTITNIANRSKAINHGKSFDLMYANQYSKSFNAYRQFAFLRKAGDETLLIVVNFSGDNTACEVTLPQHALEYLDIKEGEYKATDLLTGQSLTTDIMADKGVKMDISGFGSRVWKLEKV